MKIMPGTTDPDVYQTILNNLREKTNQIQPISDAEIENARQQRDYSTVANAVSKLVSSAGSFQGQQVKPMDFTEMGESGMQDIALKRQQQQDKLNKLNADYTKDFQAQQAKDAKLSSERSAARQAGLDQFTREKNKQELEKGKITEGSKQLDKDYAKRYSEWTSTGIPDAIKNLDKLRNARKIVAEYAARGDMSLSGKVVGQTPSSLRTTKSLVTEQDVQSIAQAGLRAILGSAFTEDEGKRIMRTSYDVNLPPEENLKRIDATLKELEERMANNMSKMRFFENNNYSLNGWRAPFHYADPVPQTPSTNTQTLPTAGEENKEETRVKNGITYKKVQGGWRKQ
jgi:hypothetical protein